MAKNKREYDILCISQNIWSLDQVQRDEINSISGEEEEGCTRVHAIETAIICPYTFQNTDNYSQTGLRQLHILFTWNCQNIHGHKDGAEVDTVQQLLLDLVNL